MGCFMTEHKPVSLAAMEVVLLPINIGAETLILGQVEIGYMESLAWPYALGLVWSWSEYDWSVVFMTSLLWESVGLLYY